MKRSMESGGGAMAMAGSSGSSLSRKAEGFAGVPRVSYSCRGGFYVSKCPMLRDRETEARWHNPCRAQSA